jgi:hypothetical protein
VVACLEELDPVSEHLVDQPIGLVDAAGPYVAAEVLEMRRLTDATVRIAERGVYQIECAQGSLAVRVDPVPEVLEELVLEDGFPLALATLCQGSSASPSSRRSVARSLAGVRPRRAPVRAASRRAAFFGDRRR